MTQKPQRTILIIDDSPEDRETYRQHLKRDTEYEYRFFEEELGESGLKACRAIKPDCVLIDYMLPDLDGLEVLRELAHADGQSLVPVVMLTGSGSEEIAVQAMKNGAQDYLVKDMTSPENLRRAVENAIDKAAMRRMLDEQRRALVEKNGELEKALEALHLLERGIHQATESIIITTADLDPPGPKIVFVNLGFTEMTGYTAEEATGNTPRMLQGPKTERAVLDELRRRLERGEVFRGESINYRKDATEFVIEWSVAPVRNKAGEVTHFVAAQHDITERRRAEEEREQLLGEVQETNRIKDEFLATLSHELRTPMTAILGWTQLMQTNDFDEAQKTRALETIYRNARSQTQLIDDLLDVSRIITGKFRLEARETELSAVIVAAADTLRPAADAKKIRLQTLFDPEAGPVSGDADRLQQVVWNLVSNAIKFTPEGGRVQVRLERAGAHVEIKVEDTGKGIPQEFLPHVFDRFRQVDQTTTRAVGGLGLGLAIVRQIVELHGGTIDVESAGEGLGATFTMRLPLSSGRTNETRGARRESAAEAMTRQARHDCLPQLENLRVLIVDDEPDTRDLFVAVLADCGARVQSAGSAAEAMAVIERDPPDVLIADIGMPGEDGYSLINKVRRLPSERGGETPAAALTAYARTEDRTRALAAGFQIHIAKPVEPANLLAIVANLSGRMKDEG